MTDDDWPTAVAVLRLATQLIEDVQDGLRRAGFDDVRPAHGFAFTRLAAGPATAVQLAEYLGITKQAASELAAGLVARGYLRRRPDPADGRQVLLELTDRGWACTTAAQDAAENAVQGWRQQLSPPHAEALSGVLRALARPGPLRPSW